MKKSIFVIAITLLTQFAFAQVPATFFTKANAFFKQNVSNGKVNYSSIKSNPSALNDLLEIAAHASVSKSNPKEFKAFYINSYNLAVIKGITEKYPVASPLKIGGFFDAKKFTIANKKVTLNGIENNVLRANFPKEARFHFALVCAGLGCPPIISEAYTPSKLESQLQRQTVIAINNPSFIKVNGSKVKISKIFEWYAKDFKQFGPYVTFLNKYRKTPIDAKAKVSFYEYDWTLNDLK